MPEPDGADLDQLREPLVAYRVILDETVETVSGRLGRKPTARIKNRGTILEKLERQGGSWLKSMQDVAGMRIVGSLDLHEQDVLVEQIVALFSHEARAPRVADRRARPSYGYRAVHVIVFPDGTPVETQVRTSWQHEWAEMFEKLADKVGRGIRYGEPPESALRRAATKLAMALSDAIAVYEAADEANPAPPALQAMIQSTLSELRGFLDFL